MAAKQFTFSKHFHA